jgi:ABC-type uncharacterized transport system substrate-binding protein
MQKRILYLILVIIFYFTPVAHSKAKEASDKKKILVVSSYHREYLWSQETNEGLCAGMLKYGYFDNDDDITEYTKNDYIETSKVIMKKLWMNTKKKKGTEEIASAVTKIVNISDEFKPDLIFLGDDNAAKHIGNQLLDTETPIVFWGVNNTPIKYGLVDSIDKPGHNVTGVYQSGYYKESLELLQSIVPGIKTIAILSDDTASGRSHVKKVERLIHKKNVRIKLVETVVENSYEEWKRKAMELQGKVDAFFIAQYSGLMTKEGTYVPTEEVSSWYINNINIPEAAVQGQFVKQGMLCSADDSGYNQGFSAVTIAHDILENGKSPETYPPIAPKRGALMANKKRGKMLGITFTKDMGIEEYL